MYEEFYGFEDKPFSMLPNPGFIYLGKQHRKAYSMMEYGILSNNGYVVLTGVPGSGKTTVIRYLVEQFKTNSTIGVIYNSSHLEERFFSWVLLAFGQKCKYKNNVESFQALEEFLALQAFRGRKAILIVDEAQSISASTLENLRQLSNTGITDEEPLQLLLVGHGRLNNTLQSPALEPFFQRISVNHNLERLSELETIEYIARRLEQVKGDPELFSPGAVRAIYIKTHGVPRLINQICNLLLLFGYVEQKRSFSGEFINRAISNQVGSLSNRKQ